MKVLPSKTEVIELVRSHYGLTLAEAMQVMNSALHPQTLRDDIAMRVISQPDFQFTDNFSANITGQSGRGGRRPLNLKERMQLQAAWQYAMADELLATRLPKT